MLVYLAVLVLVIAGVWKVFSKAGKPGWAALIPFYNTIVLLQIAGRPLWWFFLLFVPLVNIVVAFIIINDLAKSFGKSIGWTIGLVFLPFIFYPMLGFGKATYTKPAGASASLAR